MIITSSITTMGHTRDYPCMTFVLGMVCFLQFLFIVVSARHQSDHL